MMIGLTQGQVTEVDPEDYYWLSEYKWCAGFYKNMQSFYALTNIKIGNIKTTIPIHKMIMNSQPGMQIDHINHDTLDNRKCNLRITTPQQNSHNQKLRLSNSSGKLGICFHKPTQKWLVRIYINKKRKYLGLFTNFDEAVNVRKAAEVQYGYHPNHGRKIEEMS